MKDNIIARNFYFLTIIKGANLILPLIIYTYVIGVLGFELYGKVIYSNALIAYFLVVVEYGFNISGTKEIAENKNDKEMLGKLVISILYSKIVLVVLSYVLLGVSFLFISFLAKNAFLILFSSLLLIADVVTPTWYFQGKEKLGFSTIVTLASKLVSFCLILIVVNTKDDYLLIPLIYGLCSIGSGIIITYRMLKEISIVDSKFKFIEVVKNLKKGFPFFFSRFFIVVRERIAMLAIGSSLGFQYVSYLDLLQKIISLLITPIEMLNTAVYPRIAATKNLKMTFRFLLLALGYAIFVYLVLVFFPYGYLPKSKIRETIEPIVGFMPYFGVLVPLQALIYFTGNTILVVFGYIKEFNYTVVLGGILYLVFISLGSFIQMDLVGISYCLIASYSIIVLGRFYYIRKYKLQYNGIKSEV